MTSSRGSSASPPPPDGIALKADDEAWTYAQLDAWPIASRRLVLRESPDRSKPVALLFDHGIGGVASIMGVLKAGRAYCALSPAHPARAASGKRSPTCNRRSCFAPDPGSGWRAIALHGLHCAAIDPRDMQGNDRKPDIERSADDIAAIYYTSGTTGRPKGVMLSHRHLLHRAWLSGRTLGIAPGDPMSQIAEISFAAGATDIFVALLAGATICPFDARTNSLRQLAPGWTANASPSCACRSRCSIGSSIRSPSTDRFPHVRYLQPAGKLGWNSVDRYRKHFGRECRLVRQLAATETSLLATMMVDHERRASARRCRSAIRSRARRCGWRERTARASTSAKSARSWSGAGTCFPGSGGQPETFCPPGEARVHRMGDLGRWLPDGSLEFVGRTDSRVKIRGFTVDPRAVEAAIGDTGLVIDATVVAQEDESREAHLVAYVVPASPRDTGRNPCAPEPSACRPT